MIHKVGNALLPFEGIVVEEMSVPLVRYNFQLSVPLQSDKDQLVAFVRERQGLQEKVWFQRALYNEEQMRANDIDDEVDQMREDEQGKFWLSRHYLSVQFIISHLVRHPGYKPYTSHTTSDLLSTGKVGMRRNDENWFYFADEKDLRRLLQEILPLIITVGLQSFDDHLEDISAEQRAPTTA